MPLALISNMAVDCQCEERRLLVRVGYTRGIQISGESILFGRAGVIGDFKFGSVGGGVVVDVDVATATKAMMCRLERRRREVVVDVCETGAGR